MYWLRKRLLSQNFFVNRELIQKLIRDSSISPQDTVIEIGSGQGIMTRELLKITPHVIAIEKDPRLSSHPQDFLTYRLPSQPYKVFANIPFSITNDIVRKLLQASNPPLDCYLIVQNEAANKFIISQTNTMSALLYFPWWDIQITYRFNRSDFHPTPKVNAVLLHIKPKSNPKIPRSKKVQYFDFVAHTFVHNSRAKFIPPHEWLSRYKKHNIKTVCGSYSRLLKQQNKLKKIHRTRLDKNWRNF